MAEREDNLGQQQAMEAIEEAAGSDNDGTKFEGQENADSKAQSDAEQSKAVRPPNANVILAPSMPPICVDGPVNDGMTTINLPSEAQQRAGWYDANARILIKKYPKQYKRPQALGQGGRR